MTKSVTKSVTNTPLPHLDKVAAIVVAHGRVGHTHAVQVAHHCAQPLPVDLVRKDEACGLVGHTCRHDFERITVIDLISDLWHAGTDAAPSASASNQVETNVPRCPHTPSALALCSCPENPRPSKHTATYQATPHDYAQNP